MSRGHSCPEAATEISRSVQRDDSRAEVSELTDAVASLAHQVSDLRTIVLALKPPSDSPASFEMPPEDVTGTGEPVDVAKPKPDRCVQDKRWFDEPKEGLDKPNLTQFSPNPWMQQICSGSQMEVFDGDPRKWPTFIANFRSLVHETVHSDAQRLAILGQLLSPKLRSGFGGLLANPLMYRELLRRLYSLYGDPRTLAKTNLNDLMSLPPLRSEQRSDLELFFCKISGPVSTMRLCGLVHDLNSSALLEHTASKLTPGLHERWLSYERALNSAPTLNTFVDWLQMVLSEKMLSSWTSASTGGLATRERKRHGVRTTTLSELTAIECSICENGKHQVESCLRFLNMPVRNRIEVLRHGLCLRCLRKGHRQNDCTKFQRCVEEGCKASHHHLLHGAPRLVDVSNRSRKNKVQPSGGTDQINVGLASHETSNNVVCAVVPVVVHSKDRSVRSFALLDSGSEVSLMSERLARLMNLSGPPHCLRFRTVTGESRVTSRRVTCEISSLDGTARFQLKQALVIPNLHLGTRAMRLSQIKKHWNHLKDIHFPTPAIEQVEMLIGMDAPLAHQYLEVKVAANAHAAPVGVLTPFGWTIIGRVPGIHGASKQRLEETWIRRHVMNGSGDVEELMKRFVEADPLFDGETYVIGLLWKSASVELPCNRISELKRFFANERRILKDPQAAKRYHETICEYIRDGHAKKVAPGDTGTAGRVWYLPHHAVWNSQRTKLRVVFDASATHEGISLNQCLLKGPDFLPNLCGVLLRFRERKVPISADIERMYHQVKVKREDRSSLRFFWRPPGCKRSPETFEMQVHVFGATSSQCVCMYALRRAAMDNCVTYPEALSRMENVYVDNWLESFDTEEEAKQACREMNELLSKCGFHLRRWATTVPGLLHGLPQQDLSDAMVHMPLTGSPSESALGLVWDCRADAIYFSFRGTPPVEPTKREMLSCVARLFDPLGLLSPVIIAARVLMQELWRTRCEWDEIPAEPLLKRWQQWIRNVRHIQHVTFPRCLRARLGNVSVHVFCDASESAYGAAAYVRSLDRNGQVNARLAFAKARVAPVRRLSIPRLELLGAVIAVRIARLLIRELKVPKEEIWFWTDSNVVLWWLSSADKRFSVFVENRVTEILDGFRASQWHHVAGTENPADDLTRRLKATALNPEHRWIVGPHFLTRPVEEWPPTAVRAVDATESEEVRAVHRTILEEASDPIASVIERISDLERLLTTLTYVHRFVRRCRKIERQGVAEATEREWASHTCIRSVQRQSFPDELKLLQCGKELPRRSRFRRLFPFLDDSGLIRVGGRLAQADMDYEARHPPILPARHPLTTSLIRHVHARHCHSGVETTLNLARAQAWIVDGRAAVCRVLSECTCSVY